MIDSTNTALIGNLQFSASRRVEIDSFLCVIIFHSFTLFLLSSEHWLLGKLQLKEFKITQRCLSLYNILLYFA